MVILETENRSLMSSAGKYTSVKPCFMLCYFGNNIPSLEGWGGSMYLSLDHVFGADLHQLYITKHNLQMSEYWGHLLAAPGVWWLEDCDNARLWEWCLVPRSASSIWALMSYYWTVGGEGHNIDTSLTVIVKLDFYNTLSVQTLADTPMNILVCSVLKFIKCWLF